LNKGVEAISWFIEEEERGIGLDGRGERQLLFHPF
jgi:hypothetical protein